LAAKPATDEDSLQKLQQHGNAGIAEEAGRQLVPHREAVTATPEHEASETRRRNELAAALQVQGQQHAAALATVHASARLREDEVRQQMGAAAQQELDGMRNLYLGTAQQIRGAVQQFLALRQQKIRDSFQLAVGVHVRAACCFFGSRVLASTGPAASRLRLAQNLSAYGQRMLYISCAGIARAGGHHRAAG